MTKSYCSSTVPIRPAQAARRILARSLGEVVSARVVISMASFLGWQTHWQGLVDEEWLACCLGSGFSPKHQLEGVGQVSGRRGYVRIELKSGDPERGDG